MYSQDIQTCWKSVKTIEAGWTVSSFSHLSSFLQKREDRERSDSDEEPFSNCKGVKLSVQLRAAPVCECVFVCVPVCMCAHASVHGYFICVSGAV